MTSIAQMERRRLGGTDMDVSWLGFGAARIATDTGSPAKARGVAQHAS